MNRRGWAAVAILVAWVAGLGVLARREMTRGMSDRLAEVALRVNPGAVFYAVFQGGRQIGFASSTIDTTPNRITVVDFLSADVPAGGTVHRATARTSVRLTRAFRLADFEVDVETGGGPLHAEGSLADDSTLNLIMRVGDEAADTQQIRFTGPIVLPTTVPLAVILGDEPEIGTEQTFQVFDPTAMAPKPVTFRIAAESLFVVDDSAAFDSTTMRWVPALRDTVRAWKIQTLGSGTFSGWVDAQGRLLESTQMAGLTLRRMAYELAFENWRNDPRRRGEQLDESDDVIESTAIASNAGLRPARLREIRVRLSGVDLDGFDLHGDRQQLRGDTLVVVREERERIEARYALPASRVRFRRELAPEPLIQSGAPEMVSAAIRIAGRDRDPVRIAEKLTRWVYDSIAKRVTVGLPSAMQVLRSRRGDCNEHTQLYLALARALGLPARAAAGLALVNGKFYYHAWPEVYLDRWVAVDPTFGQFPADAAHLRFTIGGLSRQAELLRLIGALEIDVIGSQ